MSKKNLIDFSNFDNIGASSLKETTAFKKIRLHSKTFTGDLLTGTNNYTHQFKKINTTFKDDTSPLNTINPKTIRQHNFLNLKSDNQTSKNFLDETG